MARSLRERPRLLVAAVLLAVGGVLFGVGAGSLGASGCDLDALAVPEGLDGPMLGVATVAHGDGSCPGPR